MKHRRLGTRGPAVSEICLGCIGTLVRRWLAAVALALFCLPVPSAAAPPSAPVPLSPADVRAIKATIQAYRSTWLANDAAGVLRTFTDDAVLVPAHGAAAIVGKAAMKKYWFTPGGPPTKIVDLQITVDQVGGNAGFAYARGLDGVAWTVTEHGKTTRYSHPGTYLNVMKKMPDGTWRIHVHMWDDGPQRVR